MPLPPLLLERLKRRKIIQETPTSATNLEQAATETIESRYQDSQQVEVVCDDNEEEEIIAENYSDDDDNEEEEGQAERGVEGSQDGENEKAKTHNKISARTNDEGEGPKHSGQGRDESKKQIDNQSTEPKDESVIGCPNKYNIYHECSEYCIDNYSDPESVAPTMEQRKQLALVLRAYPMSNEWTVVYDPGVRTFYFWNIISNLVSWLPPGMNGFVSLSADQVRKSFREMDQNHEA